MTTKRRVVPSRIHTVDFLRGLTLLGILIMNSQTYSLFAFLKPQQVYNLHLNPMDSYAPVQFFVHLLVKGQVYALYSFLFGLSFYLMGERNKQLGLNADQMARRRLSWLLVFGLIHALVFWFGDVLHLYALLGFSLIYFTQKSVTTLLGWVAGLAALGLLIQIVHVLAVSLIPETIVRHQQQVDHVISQAVHTWQHGSVWDVMQLQMRCMLTVNKQVLQHDLASYVQYEIMCLLGLVVGKLRWFSSVRAVKVQLLKIAFGIYPLALLLKGLACVPIFDVHILPASQSAYEPLLFSLAGFIGTPLVTIIYLIEISLNLGAKPSRLVRWISRTGCMGLTNYLVQTLLLMVLFYGYGLGLSGRLTLHESLGVVLGIYAIQVVYSNLWLNYHAQGPMEWLWRRLTYGKSYTEPAVMTPLP